MSARILTLDAGTTGLKCTLFDETGEALASAVAGYDVDLPHPGWAEQPIERVFDAAKAAVRAVLSKAGSERIAAIGLSGTMNGCVPMDESGRALYPNILHLDTRTGAQVAQILRVIGAEECYRRMGNRPDEHYSLPKILWLRDERPEVFRRARFFVNTKDALFAHLTGAQGVTDFSDASLTLALNMQTSAWDDELLRALGIDPAVMPEILPSHTLRGLCREAAGALGLPEGLPVALGAGDGACATHGAGLFAPGRAYCNIGSSAWLCTLSESPVVDTGRRIFNFADMDGKKWNICGTVQCGAAAMDWAAEHLLMAGTKPSRTAFDALEALADCVPPGSEGLFFLPTFMGERTPWWDAAARGTLIGMTLRHTRAHVARAAYEGVAQALALCGDVMRENGLCFDDITLVGGGAQSGLWPRMMADVFGVPTRVHQSPRQATSLGAAMAAGVGAGVFKDYQAAAAMARTREANLPEPAAQAAYARHHAVYRALYGELHGAYRRIAAYQA